MATKAKSPTGKPSKANPALAKFLKGEKTAGKRPPAPAKKKPKKTRKVDKLGGKHSLLDKLRVRREDYESGNPRPKYPLKR